MLKAAKAYLATQVSTSSQGDLLIMLYDTAVKQLRQAIELMRAGDVAGKGMLISKAINIISELQESLNKERGGDISKNLFQLYFFCNTRLLKANLKMDQQMVEEVIGILSGLRQAFAQIIPTTAAGIGAAPQTPDAVPDSVADAAPASAPEPRLPANSDGAAPAPGPAPSASQQADPQPAAGQGPLQPAPQEGQQAAPPPDSAKPMSTLRLRAANAYATTR